VLHRRKGLLVNLSCIVGQSEWTRSLKQDILRIAPFGSSVLVTGPSGTGKELIARAIHQCSDRATGPFVPVDCTALTGELFASHLFGHVKGAFTGANCERLGCFRAADGGTIFLDEIGELSAELQSKLLRTVQERVVAPVGSDCLVPVNVRIIAATNRSLPQEVGAGRFRSDLLYRLNVIAIETVALRDRIEDLEPLASYFLDKLSIENGLPRKGLSGAALSALKAYSWPGNVRELQNCLERAVVFSGSDVIGAEALPREGAGTTPGTSGEVVPIAAATSRSHWPTLAEVECEHLRATLTHALFNQSAAADLLDIDRATLSRMIGRHSVSIPRPRRGRPRKTVIHAPVSK
jgi:transcriptional regulator with PAS, ATPase and Fis domain